MNDGIQQKIALLVGALFVAASVLTPSDWLVEYVRGPLASSGSQSLQEKLLLGAQLFKFGLAASGFAIVLFGHFSIESYKGADKRSDGFTGEKPRIIFISLLLLWGLALRLYGLDLGLWYDEITAHVKYVRMPVGELVTTYDSENQHFLYTLLAHACVLVLGDSGWASRVPAVGFGVGSLLGVYLVGRVLLSEREALLATALLVVSYHHIWFSQNARGYTGLMFFTMISSWAFLLGLRRNDLKWWVLYAIASALGMFTHITMLFVVMSHFLIWLMSVRVGRDRGREMIGGPIVGFSLFGLLTFQLHALVLPQMAGTVGNITKVQVWNSLLWTILEFARGMQLGGVGAMLMLVAMLGILGWGMRRMFWDSPMIFALLLLPAALGTLVVVGLGHPLWPRFFFFLSGFVVLVLVRGLMMSGLLAARAFRSPSSEGQVYGTVLCVSLISLSAVFAAGAYAPKQDYEGAMVYVEQNRRPGDEVVAVGLAEFPYQRYFKTNWRSARSLDELNVIRAHAGRTWVVWTMPLHLEAYFPDILKSLKSDFAFSKEFPGTLGQGTVFVYWQDGVAQPARARSNSRWTKLALRATI